MVPSVVQREILADAQSQHFTKRVRQQTLAKTKKPLAKKIEAKVEERLAELRKEIEMLRAAKVASPVKHGSDSEEESDDEEGEGEGEGRGEHEQHDDEHSGSWFKNNELKLKTKKRKKKSKAPKIDLDFSSISQEIKKSVENVILKHWKTHGGPMHLDDHEELLAASLKKIQEAAEEQDTVGFGAVTPKARSPKASDTPDKHGEHSPSSTAGVSGTHHPAAAAEVVVVEEEEAPKPKKLSKAERMLGITAEPPMLSTRTGAAVPEQSNKVGMLSSLGSMFGSKASVKPQDMQSPGSFHQPPAAASAGTVRFKGNKVSTLKPIADEEEEENSGRSAVTNTHVSGRSMKSVASMGQSQRHTSSRAESQRSMNVELAAAEIELRTANDRLAALNDTKVIKRFH